MSKHSRANVHLLDPHALLISDQFNGRFDSIHDKAKLTELASSFRDRGQLSPVGVLQIQEAHQPELAQLGLEIPNRSLLVVFGNRRTAAARLGIETGILPKDWRIRCTMFTGTIRNAVLANAAENAPELRQDVNILDQAKNVKALLSLGYSPALAVKQAGVRGRVSAVSLVRVLLFPDEILDAIRAGRLGLDPAKHLIAVRDEEEMLRIFRRMDAASKGGAITVDHWFGATSKESVQTAGKNHTKPPTLPGVLEILDAASSNPDATTAALSDLIRGYVKREKSLDSCLSEIRTV